MEVAQALLELLGGLGVAVRRVERAEPSAVAELWGGGQVVARRSGSGVFVYATGACLGRRLLAALQDRLEALR
jgi:hypothetical protein